MAAVDVCRESLVHAVRDARQPGYLWLVPAVRSQQALLEGRFEEAESYIAEMSSPSTRLANTDQAASALAFLIQREQGRHRDLVPALEGLAQQYPALAVWRSALAMLHAEIGELGEAHAALEAVMSAGLDSLRLDVGWLSNMAFLAEACRACGTAAEAARLYELLLPYQGRNVVAGPLYYMGPIDYYLGILAAATERPVQAAKHLAVALEAARAAGALPYVARILIAHAAIAEGNRGQEDRHAAEMRREGLEIANSLGMSAVVGLAERGVSRAASTSRRASEAATVEHADAIEHAAAAVEHADAASLRREGGFWTLRYRGRTSRLKDLRGLLYLSRLLASPGVEIHALDLAAEGAGSSNRGVPTSEGDLGPILDARAKAEIRRRLADLREREEDAERNNDWQGAARARAEIEQLADELSSAVGLAGRDRRPGSAGERARASVTKAIRAAIQMIERSDPGLADILSRTVRTGIFCSYDPLDEMPLSWNVAVDSEARATRRGGS
jgi:hypothetical protein